MQFHFTDEQEQFRDMTRRFFERTCPTIATRSLMESELGFDIGVWRRMAQELGLAGIALPETFGGSGFGAIEEGIAMEEAGRALACSPLFASTVLAARAVEQVADTPNAERLLPALASGERRAALALSEPGARPCLADVRCEINASGRVSGRKHAVIDGASADTLLVVARESGSVGDAGLHLVELDRTSSGVTVTAQQALDPTRKLAAITIDDATCTLVSGGGDTARCLRRALDRALIALAHEMVGGARRLLDDTLAYTKLRMQFGRSIASFQAVKHRMSELLLNVELARSAACYAAEAADENDADLSYYASLAKASASDAYMLAATEAVQLHGGIGFTWDQDTHLWFKRAKASEVLLGDASWHRERMIQHLPAALSARRSAGAE